MKPGDRVAWSHQVYMHAPESVIYTDAAPAGSELGTVKGVANTEGTWFDVELDNGETRTLTIDELVKVTDRDPVVADGGEV